MSRKRNINHDTVIALHQRVWNEAKAGNADALSKEITAATKCMIDPFWSPGSPENNILIVAVCSGSVKSVEILVNMVVVPQDATIFEGNKPASRSRRMSGGISSYWLKKPCNPFLHAVRSLGIPKKKLGNQAHIMAESNSDKNVVQVLKALRPLLQHVPDPHRRLIMNDGVLAKAIQYNLFRTVKYLIKPGSLVDPFYCDTETAGGTYTYIDIAIRYERPVFDVSKPKLSITRLLWLRIGGLRGTVYTLHNRNAPEADWLQSIGIDPSTAKDWNKASDADKLNSNIPEDSSNSEDESVEMQLPKPVPESVGPSKLTYMTKADPKLFQNMHLEDNIININETIQESTQHQMLNFDRSMHN